MTQNFGREFIFSADLCYNGVNAKPPSEREGDRDSGGRSLRDFGVLISFIVTRSPSVAYGASSLPEGAFGRARVSLGVWALPCAFVIQRRNWR